MFRRLNKESMFDYLCDNGMESKDAERYIEKFIDEPLVNCIWNESDNVKYVEEIKYLENNIEALKIKYPKLSEKLSKGQDIKDLVAICFDSEGGDNYGSNDFYIASYEKELFILDKINNSIELRERLYNTKIDIYKEIEMIGKERLGKLIKDRIDDILYDAKQMGYTVD